MPTTEELINFGRWYDTLSGAGRREVRKRIDDAGVALHKQEAIEVLDFFREHTGRRIRNSAKNIRLICKRLAEGITTSDCRAIIIRAHRRWGNDPNWSRNVNVVTLFGERNFEKNIAEVPQNGQESLL